MKRRIFISMVTDRILSDQQNQFKWSIVDKISSLGFQPEIFYNPRSVEGIAARKSWTPAEADEVIRQCVGGIIIGNPRWQFHDADREVFMGTEYAQYEGAILRTVEVPIMVLAQENLHRRGIFEYNFGQFICNFPENAGSEWLEAQDFQQSLNIWLAGINDRRDFFHWILQQLRKYC